MPAQIYQFPTRGRRMVRVERDRAGREWFVIHGDNAWPFPSRAAALSEATELAAQWNAAVVAERET
jgi:hypothetical protein